LAELRVCRGWEVPPEAVEVYEVWARVGVGVLVPVEVSALECPDVVQPGAGLAAGDLESEPVIRRWSALTEPPRFRAVRRKT